MPKVYVCDTGFANHFGKLDTDSIFENSVFQSLRTKGETKLLPEKRVA